MPSFPMHFLISILLAPRGAYSAHCLLFVPIFPFIHCTAQKSMSPQPHFTFFPTDFLLHRFMGQTALEGIVFFSFPSFLSSIHLIAFQTQSSLHFAFISEIHSKKEYFIQSIKIWPSRIHLLPILPSIHLQGYSSFFFSSSSASPPPPHIHGLFILPQVRTHIFELYIICPDCNYRKE